MNDLIEITNIYYNNALDLVKNNKVSLAVELLEKCLNYYAKDTQVLNLMGICQYVLCDFDKAYFYWCQSLMCGQETNRANYYLDILNSNDFQELIKNYNLAISNVNNLNYKEAIDILSKIIESNKELIEPYVIIGLCYYKINENKLAQTYIEYAINKDKGNSKYLIYLDEIKGITNRKSNGINYHIMLNFILILLLIIPSRLYYKTNNKYIQTLNDNANYQKKIQHITFDLNTSKTQCINLKNELKDIRFKNSNCDNENFGNNEYEVFKSAITYFKNKEYVQAIERFEYIINKGIEEELVSESIYYVAVCFEKSNNYNLARKYYDIYMNKYCKKNYYDEVLYN